MGRTEWLRQVVADYESRLIRYAQRITGDGERARDIVQDAFLRLCRQEQAAVESCVAPWLYKVCRHRALDVAAKEQRMSQLHPEQAAARPGRREISA